MKILGWIIATPFIALALFIAARYMFCGPNREVVEVAKPMVNQIADYIVKNGIPESLEDIPNLPYRLNKCSKKKVYWKDGDVTLNQEQATFIEVFLDGFFMEYKKL